MKTKLLRKLRNKFYITRMSKGSYIVEGSDESSRYDWSDVPTARSYRRKMILKHARDNFSSYSVWYSKRID